jgi:2-aminoethylphosphonate-pyruvate transaminase
VLAPRSQVLFNPGPVNLHESIRHNLFNVELCHRQPEFSALTDSVRRRLAHVSGLEPGRHRLSLLHGSGTLAVDAALANLVQGRVVVIDNGLYCRRIAATLGILGEAEVRVFDAGIGRQPDLVQLEESIEAFAPQWLAVVHHETMTGLLNPLEQIACLADRYSCRLFVDALSAFPVHPLPPRADVVCFNSSKCLESLPGIAGIFWSRDLATKQALACLDLEAHAEGLPSTPNVQAFVALDIALDLLAEEDRPARYERLARRIWEAGSRHFDPLLPEPDRSYVLTSFRLSGADPDEVMQRALKHDFVIYQGQQNLRDEIFRVANMGAAITEDNIEALFDVLSR